MSHATKVGEGDYRVMFLFVDSTDDYCVSINSCCIASI